MEARPAPPPVDRIRLTRVHDEAESAHRRARRARQEIGGTPRTRPLAFSERSPITYARAIAASCVPLELWWSVKDRIVVNQRDQTGALYRRILELRPDAPVTAYVGSWRHSAEMHAESRLPAALMELRLRPGRLRTPGIRVYPPADTLNGRPC